MTILDILNWIEDTTIASAVRGDVGWELLFPNIETVHVLSLAVVFGSILMVDLRLLGVTSRGTPIADLSAEVLPYTWGAFGLAVITGTLMFMSKAHIYFYNLQFRLKFLCMFLAGVNMLVFHFGAYRSVRKWDTTFPTPGAARAAGALSIGLWVGVIFFGRWIGFTT
jgi:hypothetical protein